MRTLILMHNDKPMMASITAGPIRARILEWPDDDADLYRVWEVPTDYSHLPAGDITEQFAITWSMEFGFGDGIEPEDYLAPFPAFVRAAVRDKLARQWQRRMAEADPNFVPAVLRSVA
jgi:hypothetical protein